MNKLIVILMIIILGSELASGREHIHVFTSKGTYETSEDLWFKGIAIDDSTMRVSDRSHTAYVEIIDPSDSVVWREKYRMSNGMCDGHVYVGDDWQPGENSKKNKNQKALRTHEFFINLHSKSAKRVISNEIISAKRVISDKIISAKRVILE